ncbi:MAG: CoA transferase [Deltaproteobacteria bacterium]|nr:CoA transferase [Deltaproteobacteria bacterium]
MSGPLKGLKVLDFTTLLPGPYATLCIADLGAEVLKITSGSRPDLADLIPPFVPNTKLSAATAYLCRGKRSMSLNLKHPDAVEIVSQLVADYDIVVEGFRPGVMARLGLGYDRLKEVNPAIIYCSITGYGQTGPLHKKGGHDINYLSFSGIMSYSGRKESGPVLSGMQIADVASGSYNAVIGILAAVINRKETGKGQYIDISMTDGMIAFNAIYGACFLVDGKEPHRDGLLLNGGTLYDYYETKDGRHISFGGLEPQFFAAFCTAINRPDLISGGIETKDIGQVKTEIRQIFKTKTRDEWVAVFEGVDACVGPVLTLSEVLSSKHVEERELLVEVDLPDGGKTRQIGNPIKFSESRMEYTTAGVASGTHKKDVIMELGYSEEDFYGFEKNGVFN